MGKIGGKVKGERMLPGWIDTEELSASWDDFEIKELVDELKRTIKTKEEEGDKKIKKKTEEGEKLVEETVLHDIDFTINPGEFVAIIGKVVSGKSSLLHSIVGDLKIKSGSLKSEGSIALVSQQAFLVNDTLRNNIVFGKEYNEEKFRKVVEICQLVSDLKILPSGDLTEIGERGVNLSGGQKQRVSLARAVYSDSDIYLIDDCLSALDAHVGKAVIEEVLLGHLKGKTVLMASHHTHFLERTDRVILMDKGRIVLMGGYNEIKNVPLFQEIVLESQKKEQEEIEAKQKESNNKYQIKGVDRRGAQGEESEDHRQEQERQEQGRLTAEEQRYTGIVDYKVFTFYMKSGGLPLYTLVIIFFSLAVLFMVSIDWWAGKWFNGDFNLNNIEYLMIYFGLVLAFITFSTLKSILFGKFAPLASYTIFRTLLNKLMRRPLRFFDTTPSGTIVNRAVDDMETGDLDFPKLLYMFQDLLFISIGTYTVTLFISPLMIFILIACTGMHTFILRRYLRASTELKRIFRISRSPVLTTVSEMVNGMAIVRQYGFQKHLKKKWETNHDVSLSAQLHEYYCQCWICIHMYNSFAFIVFFLSGAVIYKKFSNSMSVKNTVEVALVFQYVLNLSGLVFRFVLNLGGLLTDACMIERLREYCDVEDFEAALELEKDKQIGWDWPQNGKIEIENLSIRYREGLPCVIKNLDMMIEDGSKVALLGRTGSGKSTLMLALMRVLEVAEDKNLDRGVISIDGVDISTIGLHKLRRAVSIIPQDPFLLEGSMRFNLDQQGLVSDVEMVRVLEKIGYFTTLIHKENREEEDRVQNQTIENNLLQNPKQVSKRNILVLRSRPKDPTSALARDS